MAKLWEVDPETRQKLLDVQKQPGAGNNVCVDCGSPSPAWASPKFGVFMCLNCSGIHRGLGVHVSFIRSVTMDQFKVAEVKRMQLGGNGPWKAFFDAHADNKLEGRTFESSTVKERYDSVVGEEWKERLTAKVEGREYVPGAKGSVEARGSNAPTPRSGTPAGSGLAGTGPAGPASNKIASPMKRPQGAGAANIPGQKEQNEAYFARMGAENANRPEDLPPSQGGKYAGFGSEPAQPATNNGGDWMADFQKDPMAGLTKGFGWLGKSAKDGYDGWVKPNVQKFAESEFATTSRQAAVQLGQNIQTGTKTAADSFNRFVEGQEGQSRGRKSSAAGSAGGPDKDKQEFWDNFGAAPAGPAEDKKEFWDSFGSSPTGPTKDKKDFWDSFGQAPKGPDSDKKPFWDDLADAGDARQKRLSMSKTHGAGGGSKSSIGTSAMKSGGTGAAGKRDDENWGDW